MKKLLETIGQVTQEGGDWCSVSKAQALAGLIVSLRCPTVVEIGVWMGGSAIPMALALQHNFVEAGVRGRLVAIDPWSPAASVVDQQGDNQKWWSDVNHDQALATFKRRIAKHELESFVEIVRSSSDDAAVPEQIDLLHIDGNHGPQAVRDVDRFAPAIPGGGILVMDDLQWEGGSVERAHQTAIARGFRDLYQIGTGVVMIRHDVR